MPRSQSQQWRRRRRRRRNPHTHRKLATFWTGYCGVSSGNSCTAALQQFSNVHGVLFPTFVVCWSQSGVSHWTVRALWLIVIVGQNRARLESECPSYEWKKGRLMREGGFMLSKRIEHRSGITLLRRLHSNDYLRISDSSGGGIDLNGNVGGIMICQHIVALGRLKGNAPSQVLTVLVPTIFGLAPTQGLCTNKSIAIVIWIKLR